MTVKISAMTSAGALAGTEVAEVVQSGNTRKVALSLIGLIAKTLAQLNTQISDATIAQLGATQTFTGAQQTGRTTLTPASPTLINAAANNDFELTLDAARQLDNPTDLAAGMSWTVRIIQGGAGTFALTFDTFYEFGDDLSAPDTSGDATGKERLLSFYAITATRVLVVDSVGVY